MAKIYEGQTALTIRLRLYEDLTGKVNRVLIKFRKPNGIEGWWPAEIIDYELGIIQYEIPTSSGGLDDSGFWTTWAYVYYIDGSVTPGDPVQFGVYQEGKTYIAFPYGRVSSAGVVEEMAQEAFEILYDNTTSGLVASNVQDAIDEVDDTIDNFATPPATAVTYDNSSSGLLSTNVQAAVDEVNVKADEIATLIAQTSTVVYVDNDRVDSYTEDGTIHRPYKTLAAAVAIAQSKTMIKISGTTYTENITLPGNVSIVGIGMGKTILQGTLQTGASGNCSIKEMTLNNSLTILCETAINNVECNSSVSIAAGVRAYNFNITSATAHALAVTSGFVYIDGGFITTSDNASAVVHNGGTLILENIESDNNSASNATVDSSGGAIRILSSTLTNAGAGLAADIDNGAVSTAPNVLTNVIQTGGISAGTAYTVQEGVEGGDPTGSNFSRRAGSQIAYDNTTSGLAADEVQAAIDEIAVEYNVAMENVVYVAKNGSDTPPASGVALGSMHNPYLTVQAAITSITDASSSKYYIVFVFPGIYTENLTFKPYVGLLGHTKETTKVAPGGAGTHTGVFNNGGRFIAKNIGLGTASQNLVFTHPALASGGTSIWLDNITAGTMTGNFLGGGVDFVQLRNDCFMLGPCTIHSANLTSYNNTFLDDIIIDDVGVEHLDGFGSASGNTIKDCFGEDLLCEGNTFTEFFNNYHWGTLQADGALCTIEFCVQSAPDNPANLIALNSATLTRSDNAFALGFDNTATGLSAIEVQAAMDEGFSSIKSGTGADPSYTPTNTPELFYRLDTFTLWIHDGTTWKSTTLA